MDETKVSWDNICILILKKCYHIGITFHMTLLFCSSTFGIIVCIQTFSRWNIVMNDWNLYEKSLSKYKKCKICRCKMSKIFFTKEWQIMLGLLLVLVTLHGQYIYTRGAYPWSGSHHHSTWYQNFDKPWTIFWLCRNQSCHDTCLALSAKMRRK